MNFSWKYLWLTILASFLLLSGLYPERFSAATNSEILSQQIDAVKGEREALVEEQKKLQAELDKITLEGQTLGSAVKSLDSTRKKLASDIKITQSKIASTDLNIKLLENNVSEAQSQISIHRKAIGSAIQAISQSEMRPLFLDLLASANFTEVWSDKTQMEGFSSSLNNEVQDLRITKSELAREKDKKEKVKEEILSLHKELSGQQQVVEENKKAQEKLLAETKNKEALYQQMLQENLNRQKESEADIFRLESELSVTLDPTLIPTPRAGVLSWPLDTVFVTQKFGKTVGASRLYASGSHNGVDFRASQGTRVLAMLSGTVEGTGNTDEQKGCYSYGRWVLIRHNNGLTSIYAHLSATTVKKGDVLNTGDVIGYSGGMPRVFGSGYSTGPHLHVGLFASQGVSVQQFVTSKGCKQVFVPIADVKAYLDPLAYLPAL